MFLHLLSSVWVMLSLRVSLHVCVGGVTARVWLCVGGMDFYRVSVGTAGKARVDVTMCARVGICQCTRACALSVLTHVYLGGGLCVWGCVKGSWGVWGCVCLYMCGCVCVVCLCADTRLSGWWAVCAGVRGRLLGCVGLCLYMCGCVCTCVLCVQGLS